MPMAGTAMALVLGLVIGMAASSMMTARSATQTVITAAPVTPAARTHAAAPRAATGVAPVAPMAAYRQLVADLKAAERGHDYSLRYALADQMSRMLTAQMIGSIYVEHARLVSGLAAAKANREYHAASRYSQQLAALCGSETVKAQLDFCN
jgi:hypothetical protein